MSEAQIATAVFVVTYIAIASERVHKTTAALAGGMVIVLLRVLDTEQALDAIDLDVILLLAGMMVIANTMAETGVFQWLAVRSAKLAGGNPLRVLLILSAVTAGLSAFLDNVTTVVLIAPVTLVVAQTLRVPAAPMLIALALASNAGGTATLIGDPPNILIGSYADIGFTEFAANVAPGAALALLAYLGLLAWQFRRWGLAGPEVRAQVMALDDSALITDRRLLGISGAVLGATVLGFLFHDALGYEPAAVALMGATALLLVTRRDPHHALREVEWVTLFFFIGLFIVVRGMEHTGVLEEVGRRAADAAGGSRIVATFLILWMSALVSGVVDNIPYTATMLPIVEQMTDDLGDPGDRVLWWALAYGADLGGNLTIIGASANVLVANIAARAGQPISFWQFLRYGVPATLLTVAVVSVYLWARYLAL